MNNPKLTVEKIKSLNPMEISCDSDVRRQWVTIHGALWGEEGAETAYERESLHFNRLLRDNDKLRNCTRASIYIAFIDLAVCGLSLEPGVRALCYLQPRGYKTGRKTANGKDEYEQRLSLTISGYGELVQRARAGQIRHADNPVIVYAGDDFKFTDCDGRKSVEYTLNINHDAAKPIACFMRITRADGSIDYAVLLAEDWSRLAGYSAKANKFWDDRSREWVERPNALYSSGVGGGIDTGFLMAKCIKHAFKTYPKVRVGKGTSYEADNEPAREPDYYGGVDTANEAAADTSEPSSFSPANDTTGGVTVDPEKSADGDDDVW